MQGMHSKPRLIGCGPLPVDCLTTSHEEMCAKHGLQILGGDLLSHWSRSSGATALVN